MKSSDSAKVEMIEREPPPRAKAPDPAPWPCRFCQQRGGVVVTLRRDGTLVCFCRSCEQGWCTDEHGRAKD